MSTQISSATSHHHHGFHYSTTDFQHFKKRPFDQNAFNQETAEQLHNTYKKIKTATSVNSSLSQQPQTHATPPFGTSRNIGKRDVGNDIETSLLSNVPRIIDLSTGESLESIPSLEHLQSRKLKRPIELVENQVNLSSTLEPVEESKNNSLHSHKRLRTSKEHMCNFIEEDEEMMNSRIYGPVVLKELKTGSNTISSNKAKPVENQSLSRYKKSTSNISFTLPYQKAMTRYMRSQFQHLNNEEFENEGKQLILYRPRNEDYFMNSLIEDNNSMKDETDDKIVEIDETMYLDDQNGETNYNMNDEDDQMEID
ncbi:6888_t:CDS:1 [Funneliformis caledonium]|uniref:6888_t:CDS:1 n=1 Tax=Funneliformis caledonium TaxID=1117310 RepID=A0A9N9DR57_9GLOM|nr:6888_t:CDS:1 [Funneliformis caledonium]